MRYESTVPDARTKATAFVNMMEKSTFIVAIVVAQHNEAPNFGSAEFTV